MNLQEMNEGEIYEALLERMLSHSALEGLDTREGSICHNMLAPVAMELANAYMRLFETEEETYIDTAGLDSLKIRAKEIGLSYREAGKAVIYATVSPSEAVEDGDKFLCDGLIFTVDGVNADQEFILRAETAGYTNIDTEEPLVYYGYAAKNVSAKIVGIIQGEDAESAESLRERYYDFINSAPFGGNKAAYREKVLEIDGVGGCKVDRPTSEDEGNNVYITVMGGDYGAVDDETLRDIRDSIDPPVSGDGEGFAPICHKVVVRSVRPESVYVTVGVQIQDGYSSDTVLNNLKTAAETQASAVRRQWAEKGEGVLKKSELFVALLGAEGVADILSLSLADAGRVEQTAIRYDGDVIPVAEVSLLG